MASPLDAEGREAEVATVRAFVVPGRRERWVADLDRPRLKRSKTVRLYDTRDFDLRFLTSVPKVDHTPTRVAELLRIRGTPDQVWLMSSVEVELTALDQALAHLVAADGGEGLVICVPGRLAYLETETEGGFLLVR